MRGLIVVLASSAGTLLQQWDDLRAWLHLMLCYNDCAAATNNAARPAAGSEPAPTAASSCLYLTVWYVTCETELTRSRRRTITAPCGALTSVPSGKAAEFWLSCTQCSALSSL
jgi:hypothetical protein